jgi:hypothetical protein
MKLADPDSLPPTSPKTMAVLILILIGLMVATVKTALYPSPPAAWDRLREIGTLSLTDANTLLTSSGAHIESIKAGDPITTETWYKNHHTGTWTILIRFTKTPKGDVVQSVLIRNDISHLPYFTRTWDYPEKTSTPARAQPAPAATTPPPAPSAPTN